MSTLQGSLKPNKSPTNCGCLSRSLLYTTVLSSVKPDSQCHLTQKVTVSGHRDQCSGLGVNMGPGLSSEKHSCPSGGFV